MVRNGDDARAPPKFESYEPVFPCELERQIFEIAARYHFPSILQLALVAHRVRNWMKPFLYSILMMTDKSWPTRQYPPLDRFSGRISGKKTCLKLEHVGPYVRQVLLHRLSVGEVMDVLKACPNVHHLALCIVHIYENQKSLIPILQDLPIRSLSIDLRSLAIDLEDLFPSPKALFVFDRKPFQHLTHLRIISPQDRWAQWMGLALLPKLTHLAVTGHTAATLIPKIFEECKALKLLVLFTQLNSHLDDYRYPGVDDRLFVWLTMYSGWETVYGWERGARSEAENDEFWTIAEQARQRGREKATIPGVFKASGDSDTSLS